MRMRHIKSYGEEDDFAFSPFIKMAMSEEAKRVLTHSQ